VVNQGLWLSWAILVPDAGTTIFATVTGTITVFNLIWWSLRRLIWWSLRSLGLRPLFAASQDPQPTHGQPASNQGILQP
jgi:hypothetical protein